MRLQDGVMIHVSQGSDAVAQVNKQTADIMNKNSASYEQSAAAAQELSVQAAVLSGLVDRFKVRGFGSNAQNANNICPPRDCNQGRGSLGDPLPFHAAHILWRYSCWQLIF